MTDTNHRQLAALSASNESLKHGLTNAILRAGKGGRRRGATLRCGWATSGCRRTVRSWPPAAAPSGACSPQSGCRMCARHLFPVSGLPLAWTLCYGAMARGAGLSGRTDGMFCLVAFHTRVSSPASTRKGKCQRPTRPVPAQGETTREVHLRHGQLPAAGLKALLVRLQLVVGVAR